MGCEASRRYRAVNMKSPLTGPGVGVRITLVGVLSLSVLGLCFAGESWAAIKYPTHVSAQELGPALELLAREHNFQVLYRTEVVRGVRVHPLDGDLSTEQALRQMLSGTGLSYRYLGKRAITIVPASLAQQQDYPSSPDSGSRADKHGGDATTAGGGGRSRSPFRMAQVAQGAAASDASLKQGGNGQDAGEPALGEVIVTAQKYAQRAFDVPISLAVLTAYDLDRNRITNLTDLQYYVPGLFVQGGAQHRILINGISNVYGSGALVGVYIDDADATSDGFVATYGFGQLDSRTYDMARVEVLRGPQGTLYGEGSMGGAVHLVTNKPVLSRFEMSSDIAAEFTQDGAPSQRIDMMLNTPLVQNTLGLRVAGEFEHEGGWIDAPAANVKNFNDQNLVDVRAEISWEPTQNFKLSLMQIEHRNSYGLGMGEDSSGNYTQYFNQTTIPHGEQNTGLSNVTLSYQFDGAQLLSSTTYFHNTLDNINWGETLPIFGVTYDVYYPYFLDVESNLTEELRLSNSGESAWHWTAGYFYKHFTDSNDQPFYFDTPQPPGTPLSAIPLYAGAPGEDPYGDREKSWSAFADTSYTFLGRLTLGAGTRYYKDDSQYYYATTTYPGFIFQTGTFTSTDPRLYVRYGLSKEINVYASAAKGFREGGFNSQGQPPYQPESVWTYDLGTKMRLLQDRLSIDTDVYLSHYSDYVIIGLTAANPVNITRNGGTARIRGINADVVWRPTVQWSFRVNGDYIDAKLVSISVSDDAYNVGDRVPFDPEYMLAGSVERDFQWLGKAAYARLEYSQVGPSTYFIRNLGYFGFSPVQHLLNFNTGVQWNDNLRLSVYAQNLTNDRSYLDPSAGTAVAPRQRPRTIGMEFAVNFE